MKRISILIIFLVLSSIGFTQVNVAKGKVGTASDLASNAKYVFDGISTTAWNSGGYAPKWVSVNLQSEYDISKIKLIPAQTPAGNTTHEIFVTTDLSTWKSVDVFTVYSYDNTAIERSYSTTLKNVKGVKVLTSKSPSWIAWYDIEIYGVASSSASLTVATSTVSSTTNTFTDSRDSKVYKTVTIGTQTWMAENLAYLPSVTGAATSDGYWVYDYEGTDVAVAKLTANYKTYGVLYNWEKANTACPTGWHLPSDAEWTTLTTFLGGGSVVGGKMKETGTTHWTSPNTDATNSSFFTALPAGYRYYGDGSFSGIGDGAGFWSSTACDATFAWVRNIDYDYGNCGRYKNAKMYSFSVRCVKD